MGPPIKGRSPHSRLCQPPDQAREDDTQRVHGLLRTSKGVGTGVMVLDLDYRSDDGQGCGAQALSTGEWFIDPMRRRKLFFLLYSGDHQVAVEVCIRSHRFSTTAVSMAVNDVSHRQGIFVRNHGSRSGLPFCSFGSRSGLPMCFGSRSGSPICLFGSRSGLLIVYLAPVVVCLLLICIP